MNKCILVTIVAMTFCTFAQANKTLWEAVQAARKTDRPEDWATVVSIIKSDKTIDKYYAPAGDENVYHYVIAACQFEIAALLDEASPSVIEEERDPDPESLIMSDLLDDEPDSAPRARSNAVRASIAPDLLMRSWK